MIRETPVTCERLRSPQDLASKIAYHFLQGSADFPHALEARGHDERIARRSSCFSPLTDSMRTRPSMSTQNSCSV